MGPIKSNKGIRALNSVDTKQIPWLAKCTEGTVRNFAHKNEMNIAHLSVQVDYDRDRASKTAFFRVSLDVEGELSEKDVKKLFKVAEKSYIRRVLSQNINLRGQMHYNGKEMVFNATSN